MEFGNLCAHASVPLVNIGGKKALTMIFVTLLIDMTRVSLIFSL
jgi:hypothetical protein